MLVSLEPWLIGVDAHISLIYCLSMIIVSNPLSPQGDDFIDITL